MLVKFPHNTKQRYWRSHFIFIRNLFKEYGATVISHSAGDQSSMLIIIDGKKCVIDYSDFDRLSVNPDDYDAVFKMHFTENIDYGGNVFPFTPISFMDWEQRENIMMGYKYRGVGCTSYRQVAYGDATIRRRKVFSILSQVDGINLEYNIMGQGEYFINVANTLVSVHVPGATSNMLDRAQLQYMGLGCCTLSPKLPEILPFYNSLIPNVDYILCKDDYSDLEDKINWCNENKEACINIGANALKTFSKSCTPESAIGWVKECLNGK